MDNVFKDSLNTDPRFVTIEGWKFLYWNAQYILDRLPAIPEEPSPNLTVKLTNSSGALLTNGSLQYYEGAWKDAVNNGDGTFTIITDKQTLSIRMTYEGGSQQLNNVPAQNNTYTFQTVNASVQLKNSSGELLSEGQVQYYAGSWRDFGNLVNGIVSKELLPKNYSFRMTHDFISNDKQQDIGANDTVIFSTVLCTVKVTNNQNQPVEGADVKYYSGAWRNFGTTVNGEAVKEMLPKSLSFRVNYNGQQQDKTQDIGINSTVEFTVSTE